MRYNGATECQDKRQNLEVANEIRILHLSAGKRCTLYTLLNAPGNGYGLVLRSCVLCSCF